jgi:hypothetical protein
MVMYLYGSMNDNNNKNKNNDDDDPFGSLAKIASNHESTVPCSMIS